MASVTTLCQFLLSGSCFNYNNGSWPLPGSTGPPSQTQCEMMFATVPLGAVTDTNTNSIGCRQNYANMAQTPGNEYYCRFAALSGGGVCGNIVQNTCEIIVNTTCANSTSTPPTWVNNISNCVSELSASFIQFGANQGGLGGTENSIECRLYHTEVDYLLGGASGHCLHAQAAPTPCNGPVPPSYDQYCGLIETTCTGPSYQQYYTGASFDAKTHWASCWNSIKSFPTGNLTAGVVVSNNNDFISRLYHVSANTLQAGGKNSVHCAHAGPSGGGVNGGPMSARASWMYLANNVYCQGMAYGYIFVQIAEALQDWPMQLAQVVPMSSNIGTYSVGISDVAAIPGNNTDACRIYHLTAAATNSSSHCAHGSISGGGVCGADPTWSTCKQILLGCPNAFPSLALCQAAFMPYFTNMMIGNPNAAMGGMAPADDSITCRVFYATQALMTYVGKNQTAPASVCMNAAILGATGCNVSAIMAPTKSDAASVSLFGGLAFLALLW